MKNVKSIKTLVLMIVLGILTIPMFAQDRPGGGQRPGTGRGQWTEEDIKIRVERLSETLECTDKQKEQLLEYEIQWSRKMQTEREKFQSGGDFDREAFRSMMQEQRKLREEKYKEILSDSQMAKYNKLMEERRQQRQQQWEEREGEEGHRQRGRGN